LALRAAEEAWSVRETERRARVAEERLTSPPPNGPVVLHPDLAEALAMAEDALTAALGRTVRVRSYRAGFRVEFDLERPGEGVELAERLLRRRAA
jgi:hypothetical protein